MKKDRIDMLGRIVSTHGALVALFALPVIMAGPLAAADLGGDCCADLEERVAELEATVARKGNRKVSLSISGQVNTGVLYFDDGRESNAYITDNDNTSTRFRFLGSAKINSELKAGFLIEVEAEVASSNLVTQLSDDPNSALSIRHSAWWLESSRLGRITVGQTSPATDDIILSDAAGAGPAAFSDQLIANSIFYRRNDGVLTDLSTNVVSGGSFDTARRNLVRYDSPLFHGAKLVASWGEDDFWDVALWYSGTLSNFKIVGGIGYLQDTDGFAAGLEQSELKGSLSILHEPSGLFGSFAYVHRDFAAPALDDLDYYYVNAGYVAKKLMPFGKTVFYGEYAEGEGVSTANPTAIAGTLDVGAVTDAELTVWGFGMVQHIAAAEMEIYALYKNLDLDATTGGGAVNTQDIDIVFTGARIKF